jgi:hypothetical protein
MSFKRLDAEDFLVSADTITAGAWTGNTPTLTLFETNSVQEGGTTGEYYLNVYQTESTNTEAEIQFSIAYGEKHGSGSLLFNSGINGKSPTSTIYGQYQNIVLGDEGTDFVFGEVTPNSQSIYALSVERSKFKGSLMPGTMTLRLSGTGVDRELTDNSLTQTAQVFNEAGRVFQIVSGSNGTVASDPPEDGVLAGFTNSGSYGLFLPDIGTILLNGAALDLPINKGGINLLSNLASNTDANNPSKLIPFLSASSGFRLNSEEQVPSDFIFVRLRNPEFNYSTNPSFSSGSSGDLQYTELVNAPQTFITTVGLYNDSNELLAVAKLSRPLKKDFTKEALIRVKLDF